MIFDQHNRKVSHLLHLYDITRADSCVVHQKYGG